jgi:exonuclease VII large subunit
VIPNLIEGEITKIREKINNTERVIKYNDPQRNLRLGYCIAKKDDKIIKSIKDVKVEEDIELMISNGLIKSKIKKIYERKKS